MARFRLRHSFWLIAVVYIFSARADPANLAFEDCFSGNSSLKLTVDTIYGQALENESVGKYLNLTLFGSSPQTIEGQTQDRLATLFTTTNILTLDAWTNSTYLCNTLRPPSPLPQPSNVTGTYCPMAAGPFGLSTTIPWGEHRALTTLSTTLRAVDPSGNEIVCLVVQTTPLDPTKLNSPYGDAIRIFWATIGLAIAYWFLVGTARIASAWGRGVARPGRSIWDRVESAGYIIASAIAGERLATSPALMRFSTPSMRDIIFHTQWCAALAMIAVEWPPFIYPLLAQTAWSTLSYNITLSASPFAPLRHWDPLQVPPFSPPSQFSEQISSPNSVLYIDPAAPNILFTLPSNATDGIPSFAYTVGIRPEDLFPICATIFLGILAGAVVISVAVWCIELLATSIIGLGKSSSRRTGLRSPRTSVTSKDLLDSGAIDATLNANGPADENKSLTGHVLFRPSSRFTLPLMGSSTPTPAIRKTWWKIRSSGINTFHGSILHGNLVRILVLFHLPLTIFSSYHMTLPRSQVSLSSVALAGLCFSLFSIILPVVLVVRLTRTTTKKLYDETGTLLSIGPLYNHYRHGSQMFASLLFATNLVFGVTIGCGQKSGTAQAIVILVVEVASALVTSIWLPWGQGASMGLISFLFCVARIVIAVLLVILTPAISIDTGAGGWVSYGILVILALVYLALCLMLAVKVIEAFIRIIGRIGFEHSNYTMDSGLVGACGLLGCCGARRRKRSRSRGKSRTRNKGKSSTAHSEASISSFTPPNVLGGNDGKGSVHSQPASVLRPEHALRPYKEESDDENGYIMGAWQPFPRPGYTVVNEPPAPVTSSGFSRVGGGRATFDTPYAIAGAGSTQSFPLLPTHNGTRPSVASSSTDQSVPPLGDASRRHLLSTSSNSGLPPGAMPSQLAHVRTKSQTAIIEDSSVFYNGPPKQADTEHRRPPSSVYQDAEEPKKKWYHIRRHRPHSEGYDTESEVAPDPPLLPPPETAGGSSSGRSFVVIRKPQTSAPSPSRQAAEGASGSGSFAVTRAGEKRKSHATT